MMQITASEIFDFIDQQKSCAFERHEVASGTFGTLRRSLRQIVTKLRESDDQMAIEMADCLRALLCEWLTSPIPFDNSIHTAITGLLGDPATVQARWGKDIRVTYENARTAAKALPSTDNPVRERLRTVIRDMLSKGRKFRIYCHRRSTPHFQSLLTTSETRLKVRCQRPPS